MIIVNPDTWERKIVSADEVLSTDAGALAALPTEAYRGAYRVLREGLNMPIVEAFICALTPECRKEAIERLREMEGAED